MTVIEEFGFNFDCDVPGWRFGTEKTPFDNGDPFWSWWFMCFSGSFYWHTDRPVPVFTQEDKDAAKKWADETAEKLTWK